MKKKTNRLAIGNFILGAILIASMAFAGNRSYRSSEFERDDIAKVTAEMSEALVRSIGQ